MELRTVATFLRVAELQNFSRAAEQLGYSQAAVTVQIQQLEQELGTQLFERIGKRTKLTAHGTQFIPYALKLMNDVEDAKNFINDISSPAGTLRIATAESMLLSILPPILSEIHRICPHVEVSIRIGLISELFDMVRKNDVDILFFLDKKTEFPEWIKVLERPEKIIFVTSNTHPLAHKKNVPLEQLLLEPFVLTEKSVSYRYDLEQIVAGKNLELRPFLETGNTDMIIRTLLHTPSVSFLPEYVAHDYISSGQLAMIQAADFEVQMASQLVYHRNKWLTPQMNIFLELMKKYIAVTD